MTNQNRIKVGGNGQWGQKLVKSHLNTVFNLNPDDLTIYVFLKYLIFHRKVKRRKSCEIVIVENDATR